MIRWVRHTWVLEGPCGETVAEAYAECCSVGDVELEKQFESTREVEVEYPRLMNGWIRFG